MGREPHEDPVPRWRNAVAIASAALAMQGLVWAVLWGTFGVARLGYRFFDLSDISYYHELAAQMAAGLAPFRDFFIEYPPLFAPLLAAPGTHLDLTSYVLRFAIVMIAFMAAACAATALASSAEKRSPRPYLVAAVFSAYTLLLGPISANRYDSAVALVLALILLSMARDRWVVVAVLAGVGFALKLTPAVLLPLMLLLASRKKIVRMLLGFSLAATVPFLWVLLSGGSAATNLLQLFAYHAGRPLEIESVAATPFWIGGLLGVTTIQVGLAAGSQVIVSAAADLAGWAATGALVLALGAVLALAWRRRQALASDVRLRFLAVLATLLASLVGSKVLSPQYFVWIVPAVALVALDRRVLGALLAVVLLLTHVEFPANYLQFAVLQAPSAVSIVVLRNVILVAAFALSLWHLWRIPGPAAPGSDEATAIA